MYLIHKNEYIKYLRICMYIVMDYAFQVIRKKYRYETKLSLKMKLYETYSP